MNQAQARELLAGFQAWRRWDGDGEGPAMPDPKEIGKALDVALRVMDGPDASSPALRVVVYGMPAPQGSKSYKGLSKAGRAILVESSKRVAPWRECVRATAVAMRTDAPLDEPLRVRMTFTLPKPSSAPKRRQTWPMRTPDLSKLVRSTEDALTDAGIWKDDARIVECIAAKRYPNEGPDALDVPGCVIEIERIAA